MGYSALAFEEAMVYFSARKKLGKLLAKEAKASKLSLESSIAVPQTSTDALDNEDPATAKSRRAALRNGTCYYESNILLTLNLSGNQLSIVDHMKVPMCHGFMVDFQPDLQPLKENEDITDSMVRDGLWHVIRFSQYIHGWGEMLIPADHIYDHEGLQLTKNQRSLRSLSKATTTDGFLVWWEYIQPRKIQMECKAKRKSKKEKK